MEYMVFTVHTDYFVRCAGLEECTSYKWETVKSQEEKDEQINWKENKDKRKEYRIYYI
jgi:hypothetical protein